MRVQAVLIPQILQDIGTSEYRNPKVEADSGSCRIFFRISRSTCTKMADAAEKNCYGDIVLEGFSSLEFTAWGVQVSGF